MKIIPECERFLPLYVVLGRAPGHNAWQGRTEESFSMGWSPDRVRLWWSGKAYSFLGEHTISGKKDAEYNADPKQGWEVQVFDLSSDECPIEIDLVQWLNDLEQGQRRKFAGRNPSFVMRDDDHAQVQATKHSITKSRAGHYTVTVKRAGKADLAVRKLSSLDRARAELKHLLEHAQ